MNYLMSGWQVQERQRLRAHREAYALWCPTCKSPVDARCVTMTTGGETRIHSARYFLSRARLGFSIPGCHRQWVWTEAWRLFGSLFPL